MSVSSLLRRRDTVHINLPLQIKPAEIERMIRTVDKNGDGKISYSEFRVMLGAMPLVLD